MNRLPTVKITAVTVEYSVTKGQVKGVFPVTRGPARGSCDQWASQGGLITSGQTRGEFFRILCIYRLFSVPLGTIFVNLNFVDFSPKSFQSYPFKGPYF